MVDVFWVVLPVSLLPLAVALVGTYVFLRYPDSQVSVVVLAGGIASLLCLFDLLTDVRILSQQSLRDVLGNVFQASGAMVGILGSFLVFYIDTIKERILQIRKDIVAAAPNLDFVRMFGSDREFRDYIRDWVRGGNRLQHSYPGVRDSLRTLEPLVREEEMGRTIVASQLTLLFVNMFMSVMLLLYSDSIGVESGFAKVMAYLVLSFSAVTFASAVYGVYRIIYPDDAAVYGTY
jgi:hypothetical protein